MAQQTNRFRKLPAVSGDELEIGNTYYVDSVLDSWGILESIDDTVCVFKMIESHGYTLKDGCIYLNTDMDFYLKTS